MAKIYIPSPSKLEQWEEEVGESVNCIECGKELMYGDERYEDDDIIEYDGMCFCTECWVKYGLENFRYQG